MTGGSTCGSFSLESFDDESVSLYSASSSSSSSNCNEFVERNDAES